MTTHIYVQPTALPTVTSVQWSAVGAGALGAGLFGAAAALSGLALLPALAAVALGALLGVAAWWDLRSRTIPSWLSATSAVLAAVMVTALAITGSGSFVAALVWAGVAGAVSLGIYLASDGGAIGGGDVKLLPSVAALLAAIAVPLPMLALMATCALIGIAGLFFKQRHVPLAAHLFVGCLVAVAALTVINGLYAPVS